MFSGTFSFLSPMTSGSGGGGITATSGSGGGGTFSFSSGGGGVDSGGGYTYTAPVYQNSYSYQAVANAYRLPGAGLQAGPFGERGPYTPLDFPLMRELTPGEHLENLNPQSGFGRSSIVPYLALGVIAALLIK